MDKKTREVIQNLMDAINSGERRESDERKANAAYAAAHKLLNPPVRFAWVKAGTTSEGPFYRASVGGSTYHIERNGQRRPLGWSGWVCRGERPESGIGPEGYLGKVHPTLAAAKQACVDYGVAQAKLKKESHATPPH